MLLQEGWKEADPKISLTTLHMVNFLSAFALGGSNPTHGPDGGCAEMACHQICAKKSTHSAGRDSGAGIHVCEGETEWFH